MLVCFLPARCIVQSLFAVRNHLHGISRSRMTASHSLLNPDTDQETRRDASVNFRDTCQPVCRLLFFPLSAPTRLVGLLFPPLKARQAPVNG